MNNSLFRSILTTLEEHAESNKNYPPMNPSNRMLFDPQPSYYPPPTSRLDVNSRLSSLGLPETLASDLHALITKDLRDGEVFLAQAQQRLLEQLCTASMSPDPSRLPPLVCAAFDAFYNRAITTKMDALQQEMSTFSMQHDSASDSGESSESDGGKHPPPYVGISFKWLTISLTKIQSPRTRRTMMAKNKEQWRMPQMRMTTPLSGPAKISRRLTLWVDSFSR